MAATNAVQFATLLGRIGLNDGTVEAMTIGQGINHMETFVKVISEDQVKKRMQKLLSYGPKGNLPDRPSPVPPLAAGADQDEQNAHNALEIAYQDDLALYRQQVATLQVHISAVSAIKLHAIWYWGVLRSRCGRTLSSSAQILTNAEVDITIARIRYEESVQESIDGGNPKSPHVLKKIEKFNEWHDAFNTYLHSIRGAARIPLPYVYRAEEAVTEEMRNKDYATTDLEFMTLFALTGDYYEVDNVRVFNELMQFVLGGPGESIVKPYRSQRNGRGAMIALQEYANGSDAIELRASMAYNVLSSTTYRRQSRNFTLDDFFARLRDAYTTLSHEDVNQPVQELRKWTETMDKILDPVLQPCKLAIKTSCSDADKNFESLAGKIKELAHEVYKAKPQERNVHGLAQDGGSNEKQGIKDSELHGGNWTNKDWKRLSADQRKKVAELRKKAQNKKRKVKSLQAQEEFPSSTEPELDEDDKSEKAGNQFGRNAHKKSTK